MHEQHGKACSGASPVAEGRMEASGPSKRLMLRTVGRKGAVEAGMRFLPEYSKQYLQPGVASQQGFNADTYMAVMLHGMCTLMSCDVLTWNVALLMMPGSRFDLLMLKLLN